MKKIFNNKYIQIILILLIGGSLGWLIKPSSSEHIAHETAAADNQTWTCSMHPQIRQSEAGKCPLCGMDLIPVSDESSDSNPFEIKMSPTAMQLASVTTSVITKQKPVKELRLNGKVKADERKTFSQSSHIPGRVERLMVNFTGETVQRGQVLAYIYSPDLVVAQEELFEAAKMKEIQPALFQAAKEKLKNWKLTENQIQQIIKKGTIQEQFPILADVSGVVMSKNVNLGDYIKKGESIYKIANLNTVWILFDLYESDISWVKIGDEVEFEIQSYQSEIFKGRISFIDPVINPKTRVASARVEINNSNMRLKPDMFVQGLIKSSIQNQTEALIIPKSSVMWTGERSVVYIKNTNNQGVAFEMREVKLGAALGDSYQILEGLDEGEEIATNGTFSIDAAAQLAGKPSMMSPEGGKKMTGHKHGSTTTTQEVNETVQKKESSSTPDIKQNLKPLLESYLKLKDFLVKDNFKEALSNSKKMSSILKNINMGDFKGDAHKLWMKHSSILEKELKKVNNSKDISEIRGHFKPISEQMIALFKTFGKIDATLFIAHCPMADNNKGADWLSKEEKIKNPYFGAQMLTCGSVTTTID
jgi:Cu(I)/Ag(I) efflux system membrane fusion protein